MNTKFIMMSSAIFIGLLGLVLSFLPQEAMSYLYGGQTEGVLFVKILGAAYLSIGFINWMSKSNLIGGIYNRPLALGNALHFGVTAITLLKMAFSSSGSPDTVIIAATILYGLFAIAFFKIMFTTPKGVAK